MKLTGWKRTAAAVAVAVAGLGGEAQALEFGNGDLMLAIYGNNTEYLRNLGQVSTLFSSGPSVQFNIGASDLTAVSGTNPVKFALYGFDASTASPLLFASSRKALADYTATQLSQVSVSTSLIPATLQSGQLAGDGLTTQLLPASNANSFTSLFGTSGTLAGGFPVSTEGTLGSLLHLLQGDFNTNALSTIGHAILALDGSTLTITAGVPAPVPVPAAVILFGSGLIGIVGIARRSMMMQS